MGRIKDALYAIAEKLRYAEDRAKDGNVEMIDGKLYRYNAYQDCWNRVETTVCHECGDKPHLIELSKCIECNACGRWDN